MHKCEPFLFRVIASLASRRHGVVRTDQMLARGATKSWIRYQQQSGRLHRQHHAVYAVGHSGLSQAGTWLAAVDAAGEGAALAGFAAASAWGITRRSRIPVCVVTPGVRRPVGGVAMTSGAWIVDHVVRRDGIDMLDPAATIAHVAPVVGAGELIYMISQAQYHGHGVIDDLLALAMDGTRRPGSPRLREAVGAYLLGDHGSDSRLEDDVYAAIQDALPDPPVRNLRIFRGTPGELRLDLAYAHIQLCIEVDGVASHGRPDQRRRDAERDTRLAAAGWVVLRVSEAEFRADPMATITSLRAAIRARAARVVTGLHADELRQRRVTSAIVERSYVAQSWP